MLRNLLLSLFWGICATCLVRPWFWKNVKNKTFFNNNGERIGFDNYSWRLNVAVEFFVFFVMFAISMLCYCVLGMRQSIYSSYLLIAFCILVQMLWAYQGKVRYTVMLILVVTCFGLNFQETIVTSNIQVPLNQVTSIPITTTSISEDTNTKTFVSSDELESLFKAHSIAGPTYNNNKYVYIANGGDNGYGIILIDRTNPSEANFIPCPYEFTLSTLRTKYPSQMIKSLFIAISDDNTPYGIFAKADKDWFLGSYTVNGYLMLNMITGEIIEYTESDLPDFVKNNNLAY